MIYFLLAVFGGKAKKAAEEKQRPVELAASETIRRLELLTDRLEASVVVLEHIIETMRREEEEVHGR